MAHREAGGYQYPIVLLNCDIITRLLINGDGNRLLLIPIENIRPALAWNFSPESGPTGISVEGHTARLLGCRPSARDPGVDLRRRGQPARVGDTVS